MARTHKAYLVGMERVCNKDYSINRPISLRHCSVLKSLKLRTVAAGLLWTFGYGSGGKRAVVKTNANTKNKVTFSDKPPPAGTLVLRSGDVQLWECLCGEIAVHLGLCCVDAQVLCPASGGVFFNYLLSWSEG